MKMKTVSNSGICLLTNLNTLHTHIKSHKILALPSPCISESCIKIKINLNFYFDTSLWCLKRFYEGLYGLHKTF